MWLIIISILVLIANANTLVSVSAGLDGLADWSRSLPYVNLVRQARPWGSPEVPYDHNATFDPKTGWPTQYFGMLIATNSVDMGGKYLLYAKENAQVSLIGSGVTRGEANGQLPISFGGLPIIIFISKFLPIEMSELTLKFSCL
jgi:hypothetical protein